MKLPPLSHLQILVLECLGVNRISGRELRARLAKKGSRKSTPAFYQLMSRLEDSHFVIGEYSQKIVAGQIIKERFYQITGQGERAMRATLDFYHGIGEGFGARGGLHA